MQVNKLQQYLRVKSSINSWALGAYGEDIVRNAGAVFPEKGHQNEREPATTRRRGTAGAKSGSFFGIS